MCHYRDSMATKLTLRLPERVAARLREQSRAEGRSINETAVRALLRGLEDEAPNARMGDTDTGMGDKASDAGWRVLGDLVEVPPTRRYDPDEMRRLHAELKPGTGSIDEDLDWIRGDV